MKRQFEGQVHLQYVGKVNGIKAKNMQVGDILMWNGGATSKVVAIEFSATGKTLNVTTEVNGVEYTRRMGADRLVAIDSFAEVVESQEVAEAVESTDLTNEIPAVQIVELEDQEEEEAPSRYISVFERWIRLFFEEKGIDLHHMITVEHEGNTHILSLDFIIEACIVASKQEQRQIKDTIVKIDFMNGNVLHFMDHLANAYVRTNY